MGLLSAAGGIGMLIFGLFAGAWADRFRRRPLMIGADLGRAAVLATIPWAAMRGHLSMVWLYTAAAAAGALTVLFDAAYRAHLPQLVSEDQLLEANAKLALSQSVAEVGGPGAAGLLIRLLGAPRAILADSLSFLWSAGCLLMIQKPESRPSPDSAKEDVRAEITEGLRTAWQHPALRAIALRNGTGAFFLGAVGGLYFVFGVRELGLDSAWIGGIISFGGAFSVLGSAAAERLAGRVGLGRAMIAGAVATGVGSLIPGLAHGPKLLCAAFLCASQLFDLGWPVYGIGEATLIQSVTPNHLTGRVSASMQLLFRGVVPLGALAAGVLAERLGLRAAMLTGGIGYLLSAGWLAGCRELRNWRPV